MVYNALMLEIVGREEIVFIVTSKSVSFNIQSELAITVP